MRGSVIVGRAGGPLTGRLLVLGRGAGGPALARHTLTPTRYRTWGIRQALALQSLQSNTREENTYSAWPRLSTDVVTPLSDNDTAT